MEGEGGEHRAMIAEGPVGLHAPDAMPEGLAAVWRERFGSLPGWAAADLDPGFADAAVMAYAERHALPILTFDFEHFRATKPTTGFWRLVVDEARYAEAAGR